MGNWGLGARWQFGCVLVRVFFWNWTLTKTHTHTRTLYASVDGFALARGKGLLRGMASISSLRSL